MKKIGKFFMSVKREMKKVPFPNKKEMVTYSTATIAYVIFFGLFFSLTDFILAGIRTLVG